MPVFLMLGACSSESSKPTTPPLTPEVAYQLLNFDDRAQKHLEHAKKQDTSCMYLLHLPDQVPPLTQIDIEHVVNCSNRQAPLELDASLTFLYDPATGKWTLKRFSS